MKKLLFVILITVMPLCVWAQLDTINIGSAANNGTGESLRSAMIKTNNAIDLLNSIQLYNISAAEMGTLNGVAATLTATELNFVDGVTSAIQTQLTGKQATLVSGTNLKTVNGESLLGSGDVAAGDSGTMVYPGVGLALSTGTSWTTSITNNSANWNTAYSWGNHASAGYVTGTPWLSAGFAALASPTFTGTVSGITATMVGLGNVTNESKATMFTSPTLTGTVTFPTPFTLGAVSVTANGTELNVLDNIPGTLTSTELGYVDGVTSAVQTQLNAKQATLVSATNIKTVNGQTVLGSGNLEIGEGASMDYPGTGIGLSTGSSWTTSITNNSANWNTAYSWGNWATAVGLKANTASPTFTGTVTGTFSGNLTGNVTGNVTGSAGTVTGFTPASGSLILAGADALTFNTTAATSLILPTSGTLATTANLSSYAPLASPTFTGTVTFPTPFTLGAVSVTANGTELNVLDNIPGTLTSTELGYSDGVTSAIQTQINAKINKVDSTGNAAGNYVTRKALTDTVAVRDARLNDTVSFETEELTDVAIMKADSSAVAKANSYATGKMLADVQSLISGTVLGDTVLTTADQTAMRTSGNWMANTSYEIRDSINLGGDTINLPVGVALKFNGGKLTSGILNGNHASFVSNGKQIFDTTITFTGSWQNGSITLQDFGAKTNANGGVFENSVTPAFNACIASPFAVKIPAGYYYIDKTIKINKPKNIICDGEAIKGIDAYNDSLNWQTGSAVIYTDKDIDFVTIQSKEVFWDGGVLDAFKAWNNDHALFRYDYGYANLEGRLKFSGRGNKNAIKKNQSGPTGIYFNSASAVSSGATMSIEIQANLLYLWYGVVIERDYWPAEGDAVESWTTAIDMDINVWGCAQAYRIYACQGCEIKGYTQANNIFSTSAARDTMPEMYLGKDVNDMVIDVMFWDVGAPIEAVDGYYTHLYSVFDLGKNVKYSERTRESAQYMGNEGDMALTYSQKSIIPSRSLFAQTNNSGITRPMSPRIGEMFFDTYLGKPIWYSGYAWVDATGTEQSWNRVFSLSDSLEVYWKFDETAGTTLADATTNNIDATVRGGATINQTGKLGKSVYFDGVADSLTFDPIELGYSDFSFSAWIKFTGTSNGKILGGTASSDIYWEVINSSLDVQLGMVNYGNYLISGLPIIKDQWQLVVFVVDYGAIGEDSISLNLSAYINGRYAGRSHIASGDMGNPTNSEISIIGSHLGLNQGFKGYIDELGIWKRKLTIDEIWRLYGNGDGYGYSNFVNSWQW